MSITSLLINEYEVVMVILAERKFLFQKGYNTIQYNTIQYNTIQYNTIQYNTIQYNTIQYNTIRYDRGGAFYSTPVLYGFPYCSVHLMELSVIHFYRCLTD